MRSFYLGSISFKSTLLKHSGATKQLAGVVSQALHGKVIENRGKLSTYLPSAVMKEKIRILFRCLFIIISCAYLGNIILFSPPLAGNKRKLGMHLVIFKAIDCRCSPLLPAAWNNQCCFARQSGRAVPRWQLLLYRALRR